MISSNDIQSYISKCNNYIVIGVDQETSFYKIGAIDKGNEIRLKIEYLELYQFALTELLLFYDAGLDYNNYGISDDKVMKYFYYIDELIKVLFI